MVAPKVFVTQYTRTIDFSEANKFGAVEFMTDREYVVEPSPPKANDRLVIDVKASLSDYIVGTDFILTTGSAIPNVLVGSLLRPGKHQILKWDGRSKTYGLFILEITR